MGKEFEINLDAAVDATPDQIWDAIATGPGISTWFVGRTEIDNGEVRTAFGDNWIPAGTINTTDKPHHFAYGSEPAPDGRFIAYDYLVEGRDHSGTILRAVTSGFLPGDDWAGEYEAMQYGTQLFFATLVEYLRHFPGRPTTPVTAFGPPVADWPRAWQRLFAALGLGPAPRPGDRVRAELIPDGVVSFVNPHALAVRAPDGLYRFLRGFHGSLVAGHALFTAADSGDWPGFLDSLAAPTG